MRFGPAARAAGRSDAGAVKGFVQPDSSRWCALRAIGCRSLTVTPKPDETWTEPLRSSAAACPPTILFQVLKTRHSMPCAGVPTTYVPAALQCKFTVQSAARHGGRALRTTAAELHHRTRWQRLRCFLHSSRLSGHRTQLKRARGSSHGASAQSFYVPVQHVR